MMNLHVLPVAYMACLATARKPHTEAMLAKSGLQREEVVWS